MNEILSFGGAAKATGDNSFAGYGMVFSDALTPDLDFDFFNSETATWLEDRTHVPVLYAHATDSVIGKQRLGSATWRKDAAGIWFEGQLQMRSAYAKKIMELIKKGALGFSTAALGHLIEREKKGNATWLKQWPVFELSLTPSPAEPRTFVELKHYHPLDLNEAIRRAGMSETALLKLRSDEVEAKALVALGLRESPDVWSDSQTKRSLAHSLTTRRNSIEAVEAMKRVATEQLVKVAELHAQYEQLIATNKQDARSPARGRSLWPSWPYSSIR